MNAEKLINLFEIKKGKVTSLFLGQFFLQFFNNFSTLLLCKIYVFAIFNIVHFFQIFII